MRQIRRKQFFINFLIISNILANIPYVSAQQSSCSSVGVFGIVVLSVFITLLVVALTLVLLWYLWIQNYLDLDFILKKINKKKTEVQKRRVDVESNKPDYAFDNPYFEDDEKDQNKQKDTIILVNGPEDDHKRQNVTEMNNKNDIQINSEPNQRNGHLINNRFVKSLPLSAVFSNGPFKSGKLENIKSMDDYFVYEKPERLEVELIGRDFTGLGFNICGNMKDGIFVKNVLIRGPANDSGKIKSGDRITGVSVSFEGMVFDDAVAILSYASPYNLKVELEKCGQKYSTVEKLTNTLNANKNLSPKTHKSIVHPLYRSHSVDDLIAIQKDVSLSEKSSTSSGKNVIKKIKTEILNRIHIKSLSPEMNTNERLKPQEPHNSIEETDSSKITEKESQSPKISTPEPVTENMDSSQTKTDLNEENLKLSTETPKKVVPTKRKGKAPQPPLEYNLITNSPETQLTPTNGETIETKAQVHNEDFNMKTETTLNEESVAITDVQNDCEELNGHLSSSTASVNSDNKSEELKSVPIRANSPPRVQSPTGKTKSSSMSDLTNNKSDNKLHSVLLERAVSLDMNGQNLPEENLSHIIGKNMLILNNEDTDSMPIITWSLNKQMKYDINSSESTLNEINQSFINSIEMSEDFSEIKLKDSSNDSIKIGSIVSEPHNFVSHIRVEVPPITSTPMKTNEISANETSDPSIHLDSSFTSSDDQNQELTLKEINDFKSQTKEILNRSDVINNKEVIELSESELDDVMMSHKQFLQKKANLINNSNDIHSGVNSVLKSEKIIELTETPQYESLDFESWHYMSEDENSNLSKTQNESTLYKTALDITLEDDSEAVKTKRLPEVSGITLKSGENGQNTNTVFISSNDLTDSSKASK